MAGHDKEWQDPVPSATSITSTATTPISICQERTGPSQAHARCPSLGHSRVWGTRLLSIQSGPTWAELPVSCSSSRPSRARSLIATASRRGACQGCSNLRSSCRALASALGGEQSGRAWAASPCLSLGQHDARLLLHSDVACELCHTAWAAKTVAGCVLPAKRCWAEPSTPSAARTASVGTEVSARSGSPRVPDSSAELALGWKRARGRFHMVPLHGPGTRGHLLVEQVHGQALQVCQVQAGAMLQHSQGAVCQAHPDMVPHKIHQPCTAAAPLSDGEDGGS